MPNLAVVKPQPGDEITSSWGTSVADSLNGIQSGVASVPISASPQGTLTVTFPRAYSAAPVVALAQAANSGGYIVAVGVVTATSMQITAATRAGQNATANITTMWIAIGTPA
jgi:allophanate hydrolase subunit 2